MMVASMEQVNRWLGESRKVAVPQDWLEACIEWIHSDQGVNISHNDLCGQVLEQWCICDLRDIGASCLPPNLTQQPKVELQGAYSLQIIGMVDVSSPYYSQLQKVKGTVNENIEISATQQSQAPWQPKTSGNRMLLMTLTDGEQQIQGMEYRSIPSLNNDVSPGCKITVQGPVVCRRGVLMLTAENTEVQGGSVDALVEELTPEKLIIDRLTSNEALLQNHPNNPSQTFDTSGNVKHSSSTGQGSSNGQGPRGQHPRSTQPSNPPWGGSNQAHSTPSQKPQWGSQPQRGIGRNRGGSQARAFSGPVSSNEAMEIPDDDILDGLATEQLDAMERQQWDDDVDLETLMEHFEEEDALISQENQISQPRQHNTMPPPPNPGRPAVQKRPVNLPQQSARQPATWKPPQDWKQEVTSAVTPQDSQVVNPTPPQPSWTSAGGTRGTSAYNPTQSSGSSSQKAPSLGKNETANKNTVPGTMFGDDAWDDDDFDFDIDTAFKPGVKMEPKEGPHVFKPPSQFSERGSVGQNSERGYGTPSGGAGIIATGSGVKQDGSDVNQRQMWSNFEGSSINSGRSVVNSEDTGANLVNVGDNSDRPGVPFQRKPLFKQSENSSSSQITTESNKVVGKVPARRMFGGHMSANRTDVRVKTEAEADVHSVHSVHNVHSPSEEPCGKKLKLDLEAVTPIMKIGTNTPPYTYLKVVLGQLDGAEVLVVRVKAYISTLLSKMEYNQGSHWSLKAKINDGTATVDVELGDKMLTSLIGFSAPEAMELRSKMRQDPSLKDTFRNALTRCQHSLVQMSCLLEVEFSQHRPMPYVRRHLPLSARDLEQLIKRTNQSQS